MKPLILIGFMAAGKTTSGKALANKFALEFFDTDQLIESTVGKSIKEIFARSGEECFRRIENEVFAELLVGKRNNSIIAAGGGLLLNKHNSDLISDQLVIFLDTEFEEIEKRIANDSIVRPIAADSSIFELRSLFLDRRKKYLSLANYVVINAIELDELIEKLMYMDSKK